MLNTRIGPEQWESAGEMFTLPESWWAPLIQWFPRGAHLQELGCCGGATAIHLAKASMRYSFTLIDFNANALARAQQRFLTEVPNVKADFLLHDVLAPFPSNFPSGAVSYSLGLLEHFQDDEIVTILKSQAKYCPIVVSAVPNANCRAYTDWKKREEDAGTWKYGYEDPKTLEQMYDYYEQADIEVMFDDTMGDNFIDTSTDERYMLTVLGMR